MIKNVTLSAEERIIEAARAKAQQEKTSLNDVFRDWLSRYVGADSFSARHRALMKRLKHVSSGRSFSREEMNER